MRCPRSTYMRVLPFGSSVTANSGRMVCDAPALSDGLIWIQVAPPSLERQMPRAYEPAYTMSGSSGSSATRRTPRRRAGRARAIASRHRVARAAERGCRCGGTSTWRRRRSTCRGPTAAAPGISDTPPPLTERDAEHAARGGGVDRVRIARRRRRCCRSRGRRTRDAPSGPVQVSPPSVDLYMPDAGRGVARRVRLAGADIQRVARRVVGVDRDRAAGLDPEVAREELPAAADRRARSSVRQTPPPAAKIHRRQWPVRQLGSIAIAVARPPRRSRWERSRRNCGTR